MEQGDVGGGHCVADGSDSQRGLCPGTWRSDLSTACSDWNGSYPIKTLTIQLPNPVRAGNCLILGVQFNSVGSLASVTDDKGNNWIAGPTTTNVGFSKRMNLYYALNALMEPRQ